MPGVSGAGAGRAAAGHGWFGGFLPTVSFALIAPTGDIYYGLWYPIIVAVLTVVIGALFLPETKDRHVT
jgi:hypothetical protein